MSNSNTAAPAEATQDKDAKQQADLEKKYQETKHVPAGWNRKYVTRAGQTTAVYTKRESN